MHDSASQPCVGEESGEVEGKDMREGHYEIVPGALIKPTVGQLIVGLHVLHGKTCSVFTQVSPATMAGTLLFTETRRCDDASLAK